MTEKIRFRIRLDGETDSALFDAPADAYRAAVAAAVAEVEAQRALIDVGAAERITLPAEVEELREDLCDACRDAGMIQSRRIESLLDEIDRLAGPALGGALEYAALGDDAYELRAEGDRTGGVTLARGTLAEIVRQIISTPLADWER